MANLHETDKSRVRNAIRLIRLGINLGIFTDTTVAAANTNLLLRATVRNALTHEEHTRNKRAIIEACKEMENLSIFTDVGLAALTTTAGLLALLTAEVDSTDNPALYDGGENYLGNTPLSEGSIL